MSRTVLTVSAVLVALAVPAAASAWHYTFHDFFQYQSDAIAAGKITAKKCGPGGKLGSYDYRSFVGSSSGSGTELEIEITAKLSVRDEFKRMKDVEVSTQASPNFPPEIVDEIRGGLLDFHETLFTRYKSDKLKFRHGSLVLFGDEVIEPGEGTTKFKPKPGC